jgi:hypothetical protein
MRFWEHELRNELDRCIERIAEEGHDE